MDFEDLTPDLKERLKACKTQEDLRSIVHEAGADLTDEDLQGSRAALNAACIS